MRQLVLFSALLAALVLATIGVRSGYVRVPERWNPWAPLDVTASPDFLTRFKLSRLSAERCPSVLREVTMQFEVLTDRETEPGCALNNAVRISSTPTDVGQAFSLTCQTAVSVALWERNTLQPASLKYFGQPVSRIEHFGSYSCRNVYGRPAATRSRHATAEAWDVAGFVLADGRRVRIARDWQTPTTEAAFLREVRDGACDFFDGVLSPDYNAAHHDHLHLDRGPFRMCR